MTTIINEPYNLNESNPQNKCKTRLELAGAAHNCDFETKSNRYNYNHLPTIEFELDHIKLLKNMW